MAFEPRLPLRPGERHVDFELINTHIVEQRLRVERAGRPFLPRIVTSVRQEISTILVEMELAAALQRALDRTLVFGFTEAQREIASMRALKLAVFLIPDQASQAAGRTLYGTRRLIALRARSCASGVVQAARERRYDPQGIEIWTQRELHRRVLEVVGETLNLGRAAGARNFGRTKDPDSPLALTDLPQIPPEFAFRSEQLDKATCDSCDGLHGSIVQVDTPEYYDLMPPSYCYGGGRCRGVYVFEDGPDQEARGPDSEPGPPTGTPPPLPPVRLPYDYSVPKDAVDPFPSRSESQIKQDLRIAGQRISRERYRIIHAPPETPAARMAELERRLEELQQEQHRLRTSLAIRDRRAALRRVSPPGRIRERAHAIAKSARRAEPRISRALRNAVEEPKSKVERLAGWLHRLKSVDEIQRKIQDDDRRGVPMRIIRGRVRDAVRYTAILTETNYVEGVKELLEKMALKGFRVQRLNNYWLEAESDYVGINAVLRSPSGQQFELQFHTERSFRNKHVKNHPLYRKYRTSKDRKRRAELSKRMAKNTRTVPRPPGVERIRNR